MSALAGAVAPVEPPAFNKNEIILRYSGRAVSMCVALAPNRMGLSKTLKTLVFVDQAPYMTGMCRRAVPGFRPLGAGYA